MNSQASIEHVAPLQAACGEHLASAPPPWRYRIADRSVSICVAERRFALLLRALEHRRVVPDDFAPDVQEFGPQDLQLNVWQTSDAATWQRLLEPWRTPQARATGTVVQGAFSAHYDAEHGVLCSFDAATGQGYYVMRAYERLPFWEWAAPFRLVFHWWAASWNGCLAHAAAVGSEGRGLLLVGRGGSGKSTTAVACLDAAWQYVSDDYSLITSYPRPRVHALYASAKLHSPFMRAKLPHWEERVACRVGPERKCVFFLETWRPAQLPSQLDLVAVVLPHIGQQAAATLEPASSAAALRALAPSSLFQLPGDSQRTLSSLARSVGSLSAYRLQLGGEIASAPRALQQLCGAHPKEQRHAA